MIFIEFVVFLSVLIVIINITGISFVVFNLFIKIPIVGEKPIFVSKQVHNTIFDTYQKLCIFTRPFFLIIFIFYLIFYGIYLFIINIIPETGIQTLFIPIRELLLKIPPLPELDKYGVFKLLDGIFNALGLSTIFKKLFGIQKSFYIFSRENIQKIINTLIPNYNLPENEPIEKKENKNEPNVNDEVYKMINNETNICIKNNTKPIEFGMSEIEKMKINMENNNEMIKCRASSIGKYIRTNN